MRKYLVKEIYKSGVIWGLSNLVDFRRAYMGVNGCKSISDYSEFNYYFTETNKNDLFLNENRIYVIRTASNKFIEVTEEDLVNFKF